MRTRPESSMRSPLSEYQMSAGVCTELRASKNRLREAGTAGPVGDRVTMVSLYRTAGIAPGTGGEEERAGGYLGHAAEGRDCHRTVRRKFSGNEKKKHAARSDIFK